MQLWVWHECDSSSMSKEQQSMYWELFAFLKKQYVFSPELFPSTFWNTCLHITQPWTKHSLSSQKRFLPTSRQTLILLFKSCRPHRHFCLQGREHHHWCCRSSTGTGIVWPGDNAGRHLHILLQPLTLPLNWQAGSFWHILLPTTGVGKVCLETSLNGAFCVYFWPFKKSAPSSVTWMLSRVKNRACWEIVHVL